MGVAGNNECPLLESVLSVAAKESGPVRLDVQASVQATEDAEKVETAIKQIFPQDIRDNLHFKTTKLRGHYHNPILRIETQLTQHSLVRQTLSAIGQKLPSKDRDQIAHTFASRINTKGHLFLRFDKQEAYQGRVRIINRGDSIRVVIRFSGRKPTINEIETSCRALNLI